MSLGLDSNVLSFDLFSPLIVNLQVRDIFLNLLDAWKIPQVNGQRVLIDKSIVDLLMRLEKINEADSLLDAGILQGVVPSLSCALRFIVLSQDIFLLKLYVYRSLVFVQNVYDVLF